MSKLYHPAPTHPHFLYEPANGMEFFDNIEERDKAAADCIAEYLDGDGWGEEVEGIFVGTVTGTSQKFDVHKRPDDLDAEECDGEGTYWGEFTEMCNYRIEPVANPKDAEIARLRSDVERYRWLRDRHRVLASMKCASGLGLDLRRVYVDTAEKLDAAIDAALAGQGGCLTVVEMRVKMDDASLRMKMLFERVKDAQAPSLVELTERLKNVPEVSGAVRQPKVDTPKSKEAP
jgi:hypothetical protein